MEGNILKVMICLIFKYIEKVDNQSVNIQVLKDIISQKEIDGIVEAINFNKEIKTKLPFRVLSEFKGADLVGIKYEQLLPFTLPYQNPENAFRVISGDFVTTEDGTGIVHTAPTFGADDAKVAKKQHQKCRQCWY